MAEKTGGLSKEEREAVKQRAAELRAQERAGKTRAAGEQAVREAIAALPDDDRTLAEGIDRIVSEVAPHLVPKTWYGFPSYADEDGRRSGRSQSTSARRQPADQAHFLSCIGIGNRTPSPALCPDPL